MFGFARSVSFEGCENLVIAVGDEMKGDLILRALGGSESRKFIISTIELKTCNTLCIYPFYKMIFL